ncbi:MAG: FAD-dependent oxidoreductase [Nitrospirae bacterium GWD2_57_9]|nr:MAG: FAD-dependent oxidoreductase [Nitrospirae bacterium GWD2_57_9]OGW45218.1 MAG: FAD-dependent oxidoreductase [Nitrospirae bacterium GWC2_57_9]
MPSSYDVIIIGSGPAGIFAALELVKDPKLKILMIEKGGDIDQRSCPMVESSIACVHCSLCSILCGWGGAGAYSDGKLTLTSEFGGWLKDYLSGSRLAGYIDDVDALYRSFGAGGEVHGEDSEALAKLGKKAAGYNLELIPARIRHIGTDLCKDVLTNIRKHLSGKIDVVFDLPVEQVNCREGALCGVITEDGTRYEAGAVIAAVGREGSSWLSSEAKRLGLSLRKNPVDIGVRVELPAQIMKEITDIAYEGKFIYSSRRFRDRVRTFCMNPYGVVVKENAEGIASVNGHSYKNRRTGNTNFALLVSTDFTKPFDDPISYGRYIAGLANLLGGGVIVQRLGDLKMGRRSTPERIAEGSVRPTLDDATPGDLSFVLPYRHLHNITEMLEALDNVAPGVNSGDTLLYGVEVKFYSMRLELTADLETAVKNFFAVGDGAGVSRGLVQASISGVVAAREVRRRVG